VANQCVGCQTAGAGACTGAKPVCASSGAMSGQCVQCVGDTDCSGATPICTSWSCGKCTADSQCVTKLGADPGVCMSHQDGRCATVAETMFVKNSTGTCSNSAASGGTAATPFCGVQTAINALSSDKRVIVVRGTATGFSWAGGGAQVTVVGQSSASIGAFNAPGVALGGGDLHMRDITVSGGSPGISAQTGATLQLLRTKIATCTGGGILLAGANFDLNDVLVENNGSATDGAVTWSGIYVKAVPTSGLRSLSLVSSMNNQNTGISCVGAVTGTGVLATGNGGGMQITPSCGFSSCTAGAGCGSSLAP
jgi:hypothetical protein